jgi:hypothetical protein
MKGVGFHRSLKMQRRPKKFDFTLCAAAYRVVAICRSIPPCIREVVQQRRHPLRPVPGANLSAGQGYVGGRSRTLWKRRTSTGGEGVNDVLFLYGSGIPLRTSPSSWALGTRTSGSKGNGCLGGGYGAAGFLVGRHAAMELSHFCSNVTYFRPRQ